MWNRAGVRLEDALVNGHIEQVHEPADDFIWQPHVDEHRLGEGLHGCGEAQRRLKGSVESLKELQELGADVVRRGQSLERLLGHLQSSGALGIHQEAINREAIKRQSRANQEQSLELVRHLAHDLGARVQQAFLIKREAEQPLLIEQREHLWRREGAVVSTCMQPLLIEQRGHLLERRRLIGET